jgi:hypothetical protein
VLLLCEQIEFVEWTVDEAVSTLGGVLEIYSYPLLLQLPQRNTCIIYGCTKWNWSINSETLDTCWTDKKFLPVNQWQWVTARKEQCHFVPQIVYCAFPYKR